MIDTRDVAVFLGLDVGKGEHHATGMTPDGNRVVDKPLPNSEPKMRAMLDKLTAKYGRVLVVVDQPASIGALPLAVARDAGCGVAYLPGLTMRRIADLYPGEGKTDARDAAIIADAARTMPHTLRSIELDDETIAELHMIVGFDDDLAGEVTRVANRLHAVCKAALSSLASFTWHRVISWWMALHRWKWKDVRRRLTDHTGRWRKPTADGIELFDLQAVTVTRYRYRGNTIPNPWTRPNHA